MRQRSCALASRQRGALRERLAAGARDAVGRDSAAETPRGAPAARDNALPTGISIAPPPPLSSSPSAAQSPLTSAVKAAATRTARSAGGAAEHAAFSTIGTSVRGIYFSNTEEDSGARFGHPAVVAVDGGVVPGCEAADAAFAQTSQQQQQQNNNAGGSPGKVVVRPLVRLRDKTNVPLWYSHAARAT